MREIKEKENKHENYTERSLSLNHKSLREKEIFWKLIRKELQAHDITEKNNF